MPFRFRLQRLLEHRQRELQRVEQVMEIVARKATRHRMRHESLLSQLTDVVTEEATQQWLMFQQGAQGLRMQANEEWAQFLASEQDRKLLLEATKSKRLEVEALETLRTGQEAEYKRKQQRRDEATLQEQVLQQWTNQRATTRGSVNDG